jgi:hypothetical protein
MSLLVPGRSIQMAGKHRMPDYAKSYAQTWAVIVKLHEGVDYLCRMYDGTPMILPTSSFTLIIQARVIVQAYVIKPEAVAIDASMSEQDESDIYENEEGDDDNEDDTEEMSDPASKTHPFLSAPSSFSFLRCGRFMRLSPGARHRFTLLVPPPPPPPPTTTTINHKRKQLRRDRRRDRRRAIFDKGAMVRVIGRPDTGQVVHSAHGYFSVEFSGGTQSRFRASQLTWQ